MSAFPREVILASAGTGKTYRLARRFLGLLARGVEPERILATTFTRKAAGEILDRVLARLAEAAVEDSVREELRAHEGAPADFDQAAAHALLRRAVGRLDRFEVRTLDSFFLRLAALFEFELGLPPEWGLVDDLDDAELRAAALSEVLEEGERADLLTLLRELQEGAKRSVHGRTLRLLDETYSTLLESAPEAWRAVVAPPAPDATEIEGAVAWLEDYPAPLTKKGTPVVHWEKALVKMRAAARAGDPIALLDVGLVKKVLDEADAFSRVAIEPDFAAGLRPLLDWAAHEMVKEVVRQNAATEQLLRRFAARYEAAKRRQGALRFEDVPRALLRGGEAAGPGPLAHRLGGGLDHLLLDEFQDTSVTQWRVLEPLARRVLGAAPEASSFFCVGDLKQSIYGWRSGEPRLLGGLTERFPGLGEEFLDDSWRSSQVVLDAVNTLFGAVDRNPALEPGKHEDALAVACEWAEAWREHRAAKTLDGRVELREAPEAAEGEDQKVLTLRHAAERAAAARRAGSSSVGILVRRNRVIPRLLFELQRLGVRASGEGGNPLTDSQAVLAALSLLWLADHPGDTAAAFHIAHGPLLAWTGPFDEGDETARHDLAARVRAALLDRGHGALLEELAPCFHGAGSWDRHRFGQLVERGHAWDRRAGGLRPSAFVRAVRSNRVEDPRAAAVQVMTVHAAKGLQFDTVVLADLEQRLMPRAAVLLADRPDPYAPLGAVSRPLAKGHEALAPQLEELGAVVRKRNVREALCLLYVAMTRAERGLEMIIAPVKRKELNFAALLRGAFAAPPPDAEDEAAAVPAEAGLLFRQPGSVTALPPREAEAPAAPPPLPAELALAPPRRPRLLPRRTPSGAEGGPIRRGIELLRLGGAEARRRGVLLHRWFEAIGWLDEGLPDEAALLTTAAEAGVGEEAARTELSTFLRALEGPQLRAALSRATQASPPVELWRERRFSLMLPDADGRPTLVNGSFDRVVLFEGAAEVLDFKSDQLDGDAAVAERAEHYRPQLELYRQALARITGLDPGAIRTRLLFSATDHVVELGPPTDGAPRA